MRFSIGVVMVVVGCGRTPSMMVLTTWDGHPLDCDRGTLVLRDVDATVPPSGQRAAIVVMGSCQLIVERSVLRGNASITAGGQSRVEVRSTRMEGSLTGYEHARILATDVQPATESADLTAYADGDASITIQRSRLRGERPTGGNTRGVVDITDSTLDGREVRGQQFAIMTWGEARVTVRGGALIGRVIAYGGGPLELRPASWTSPTLEAIKALTYGRCLATTDVRIRKALADVALGGTSSLAIDQVRGCADEIGGTAAIEPRIASADDPAALWAAQVVPLVAKLQQLRTYLDAGDDRDDGGARGNALRGEIATLGGAFEQASTAVATAYAARRTSAQTWLRTRAATRLHRAVVDVFLTAEDLAASARSNEPASLSAALDTASTTSGALFDLLAEDPRIADGVGSFWAVESGNATTWSALEPALRSLHDEIKRIRRDHKDHGTPVGLAQLATIAERIAVAYDHFSRLTFPSGNTTSR